MKIKLEVEMEIHPHEDKLNYLRELEDIRTMVAALHTRYAPTIDLKYLPPLLHTTGDFPSDKRTAL